MAPCLHGQKIPVWAKTDLFHGGKHQILSRYYIPSLAYSFIFISVSNQIQMVLKTFQFKSRVVSIIVANKSNQPRFERGNSNSHHCHRLTWRSKLCLTYWVGCRCSTILQSTFLGQRSYSAKPDNIIIF